MHAFSGLSGASPRTPSWFPPLQSDVFLVDSLTQNGHFSVRSGPGPFLGLRRPSDLLFSECCCGCGVARISLGIRLCVRRRCVSTFHFFLTFLKRACGPGAVKNSKISKNMKFLDVRKTNRKSMLLRCPDVVLVILFFFFRFVNPSCDQI